MKRIIALILALTMLCCCAAGCGSNQEDTVLTVDGTAVSFDEFMACLNQAVSELTDLYKSYSGTTVDWDGKFLFDDDMTNLDWCLKRASQQVARYHVIEQKAAQAGISVTDEQQKSIDTEIENIKTQYATGDDAETTLKAFFAAYGYTEASYRQRCELNCLYTELFSELYGSQGEKLEDDVVQAYIEEYDYVTSAHILLLTSKDTTDADGNTTSEELSDSEKAAKKAQAEEFVKELQAITDDAKRWERFKELMNEYSEDPGLEQFPEGYCFTTGTMVDEYDTATRELEEYEVSDVVESSYGYHVIMRLPTKGTDLVTYYSGYQQMVVPLTYLAAPTEFDAEIGNWAGEAKIKYTKLYESIDFSEFITNEGFVFQSYEDYSAANAKK